ncbi:MAG: outer membrane lipoprotein-sorting protein [Fimbriimonadaceae bacterium]|nr:outer membrane lipoprotein-sorting protein [Fimbriimonadaceae bacterium]
MIGTLALYVAVAGLQSQDIDSYVQKNFDDASFTARVKYANQKELAKINDDFGKSYRVPYTDFKVKEPFMMRLETKVDDTQILYIINGPKLLIRVPRIKVNSRQDLSKAPGRRQTLLDFGLLTPSLFKSLFVARFVRMDRATNDAVFDITYPAVLDDTSRSRVWIDPAKKYVTKREWFSQRGKQLATFFYNEPVQVDGIWMPTKVQVKNVDGVLAGETYYTGLKVNQGLSESLFSVN